MKRTVFGFCLCAVLLSPAMLSAQGVGRPTITNIPGGLFVEWTSPVEIAAVQINRELTGPFEIMFDVPSPQFLADVIDGIGRRVTSPEMITVLADYWIVRGRPYRAIPLYREGLQRGGLDPHRELVFMNNLALLYSRVNQEHDRALELVQTAMEAGRMDSFVLLNTKGLIFLNAGNPTEAIPPLERAVLLSCQLPIYCMHLAYAFLQDGGRIDPARRSFDPVRPHLIEAAPNMSPENRRMFDVLMSALPPVSGQ